MIRRAAALIGILSFLAGCGIGDSDGFPDYRYRMTVEVETPDGLKTGSSVIEVETWEAATIQANSGRTYRSRYRGEAVAVDLGPGETLFALLSSPENADYAKSVAHKALKPERTTRGDLDGYAEHLRQMTQVEGVHELPREHWPMLVRFRDIADPMSVEEVQPGNLASAFGPGVRLRRVTIELTDDPVTTDIEERLPWAKAYVSRHFDGSSTVLEDLTTNDLRARLSSGTFSTELAR